MNKRRLLKLADLLEADAANPKGMKFDLGQGAAPVNKKSKMPALDCGTTGCAMGLAAVSRAFKRAGLDFELYEDKIDADTAWEIKLVMHGASADYDDAAVELFNLSYREASYLFNPYSYAGDQKGAKGERAVAKRIRDFVAKGGAPDGV